MITRHRVILLIVCLAAISFFPAFGTVASGTTYYVDYSGGSNMNSGTSVLSPWKNCPGDTNATGKPASMILKPGDTVNFKGGVRYIGEIKFAWGGTPGIPVILKGDTAGWGTGKAILDGTDFLTMSACTGKGTGASQCDNDNWANMYYGTLPMGQDAGSVVTESDVLMKNAQMPAQSMFNDDAALWYQRDSGVARTYVQDAAVFTQSDDNYWVGSVISAHATGNSIVSSTVTSYDHTANKVTFSAFAGTVDAPYPIGKYLYTITGNVHLISGAGQYTIDATNSKVYVWPNTNPNAIRISARTRSIYTNSQSYITIDGFVFQGYKYIGSPENGNGCGISAGSAATAGVVVKNSDFKNIVVDGQCSAVAIFRGNGSNVSYPNSFQNNTMNYIRGRGVFTVGAGFEVRNNTFNYVLGTVIYAANYSAGVDGHDGVIDGNVIDHSRSTHGNGITVYGNTALIYDVTISNNKVLSFTDNVFGPYALAFQNHNNLTIYNNIFEGAIEDANVTAGCTYQRYYNNTFITHPISINLFQCPGNCNGGFEMKGNIIGGGSVTAGACPSASWSEMVHEYNIWTTPGTGGGWSLNTTEQLDTNLAHTYTDATNHDFTLFSGSIAKNAFPTAKAPTSIFHTDILGNPRPVGSAWDIGAYEYDRHSPPQNLRILR